MFSRTRFFLSIYNMTFLHKADCSNKISPKPLGDTFFREEVQYYMKKLIPFDNHKVFDAKKLDRKFRSPVYRFLTDDELVKEIKKSESRARYFLQIPPVIDSKTDEYSVLSKDITLDGHEEHHSKLIFLDISSHIPTLERKVVVREPNGVLRTATDEERKRMLQIYYPMEGRELYTPRMFEEKYLNEVLNRKDYLFILDRACVQFEPYDIEYHRVLIATYNRINDKADFDAVIGTRHFGSLAFYLAVNDKIDELLQYFLKKAQIVQASHLINLYGAVNPSYTVDSVNEELSAEEQAFKIVGDYIKKVNRLSQEFKLCMTEIERRKKVEKEMLQSHGA